MKKVLKISAVVIALISSNLGIAAGERDLISQIGVNNKDIQIAKMRLEGETASVRSENNLADPDVEFEVMVAPEVNMEMTLSETFEWPGIYSVRSKASKYRISAQEYLYQSKVVDVLTQARLAYVDLINVNRRIFRQNQILKIITAILDKTSERELEEEHTVLDIAKLKIEAFNLSAAISELEIEKKVIVESLCIMNGGMPFVGGVDFDSRDYDVQLKDLAYYINAYSDSPDAKAEQMQSFADAHSFSVSKRAYFPNLKLGYKYVKENGYNGHGVVFGLSLPIFSSRHKVKAAKAQYAASSLNWQKRATETRQTVQILYNELLSLDDAIQRYKELVDYDEVLGFLNESLDNKAITIIDYLAEYQFLLETRNKLDEMEYSLNSKYVELTKYESVQ